MFRFVHLETFVAVFWFTYYIHTIFFHIPAKVMKSTSFCIASAGNTHFCSWWTQMQSYLGASSVPARIMTSKSTQLSNCDCFNWCLLLVLQPDRSWLWFSGVEANNPHQMFHITQCENPPVPQILFYKSIHPWKLDISYFILFCGCHCKWTPVHTHPPDRCLWSAWPQLIANGEQMKEISRISWELPLRAERPGAAMNPWRSLFVQGAVQRLLTRSH